jgi:hypothetical protein
MNIIGVRGFSRTNICECIQGQGENSNDYVL